MIKKLLLSSLVGAIVVFIWGWFSWTVLPWHMNSIKSFTDENAVATALVANAPEHGIYVVPMFHMKEAGKTKEEQDAAMKLTVEKMEKGPFAFVSVLPKGMPHNMSKAMLAAFIMNLIAAFLISLLLVKMSDRHYGCRLGVVFTIGLLVGLLGNGTNYIWWGFECKYSLYMALDAVIAWTLAGIFMAGIARPRV